MATQDELGEYFSSSGVFRLEYLNSELLKYGREWTENIAKFDGVITNCTNNYGKNVILSAHNRNGKRLYPFKAILKYMVSETTRNLCLWIKHTESSQIGSFDEDGEFDPYKWNVEEIEEPCIFEKELILQILKRRFIDFDQQEYILKDSYEDEE